MILWDIIDETQQNMSILYYDNTDNQVTLNNLINKIKIINESIKLTYLNKKNNQKNQ